MKESVAALAPVTPPETGASTKRRVRNRAPGHRGRAAVQLRLGHLSSHLMQHGSSVIQASTPAESAPCHRWQAMSTHGCQHLHTCTQPHGYAQSM